MSAEQLNSLPETPAKENIGLQMEDFRTSSKFLSYSQNTQQLYGQDLVRFLNFAQKHGVLSLSGIDRTVIKEFLLSDNLSTARRSYAAVKAFVRWGVREGKITDSDDPFLTVEKGQKGKLIRGEI